VCGFILPPGLETIEEIKTKKRKWLPDRRDLDNLNETCVMHGAQKDKEEIYYKNFLVAALHRPDALHCTWILRELRHTLLGKGHDQVERKKDDLRKVTNLAINLQSTRGLTVSFRADILSEEKKAIIDTMKECAGSDSYRLSSLPEELLDKISIYFLHALPTGLEELYI